MKHTGRVYIGIDPGVGGGIAMIRDDGSLLSAVPMPETESDILEEIKAWNKHGLNARAALERVWSSPGWGHAGAFTFGKNYGACRMALMAAQIPFEEVLPQRWQSNLGCRSGKDKNVTKRAAQNLFPRYTITHAVADALLIAEFCRRQDRGSDVQGEEGAQGVEAVREVSAEEVRKRYIEPVRQSRNGTAAQRTVAGTAGNGARPRSGTR